MASVLSGFADIGVCLLSALLTVAALQAVQRSFAINEWLGRDPCAPSWAGVTCEGDRVVALQLPHQKLEGVLAPEINTLTALKILDLSGNPGIKGQIPDLSNLTSLTRLILTSCSLSGPVPQSMSGLTLLERLDLAYNNLSGNLPSLGKMAAADWLDVTGNPQLGGPVNQLGLEKLATVKRVHFSGCNFSGPLPADLSGMSFAVQILFDRNNMAGPMPAKLPPKLVVLQLSYNSLGGAIPPAYFKHPTLQELRMIWCKITMSLLTDLPTTESGITILDLRGNYPGIAGELPGTLSDTFPNLKYFDVSGNNLKGSPSIPKWVQMPQLSTIRLQNNHFDGMLDAAVTLPSSTQRTLDIRNNDLIATEVDSGVFLGANFSLRLLNNPICNSGSQSTEVQQACSPKGFNPPMAPSNAFCISLPCPTNKAPNYGFFLTTGQCQCDSFLKAVLAFPVLPTGPDQYRMLSHQLEIEMAAELGVTVGYVFVPAAEMQYSDADSSITTPPDGGTATIYFFNPNGGDLDPQFVQKATTGISERSVHLNSFFLFQVVSLIQPVISSAQGKGSSSKQRTVILGVAIPVGLLLLSGALIAGALWNRRKTTKLRRPASGGGGGKMNPQSRLEAATMNMENRQTRRFKLDEVLAAMGVASFDADNLQQLGRGGFGIVYKGVLADRTPVAIKRLHGDIGVATENLIAEVNVLCSVSHRNLVRLLGISVERNEHILVYEYISNGTLEQALLGRNRFAGELFWERRRDVLLGTARALLYLHHQCAQRIIHRDIKPANILLDGEWQPRLADFGLAKETVYTQEQVTTILKGTPGYIAPEAYLSTQTTLKSDVYSFGIVILVVVSGKHPNYDLRIVEPDCPEGLLGAVIFLAGRERLVDIVDPILGESLATEQVIRFLSVALHCTQPNPELRPTMELVYYMLDGSADIPKIALEVMQKATGPTIPGFLAVAPTGAAAPSSDEDGSSKPSNTTDSKSNTTDSRSNTNDSRSNTNNSGPNTNNSGSNTNDSRSNTNG